MKRKYRPGEIDAMYFDKLPQRCKEMFFEFMSSSFPYKVNGDKSIFVEVGNLYNELCKSPIEQIFSLALEIMMFTKKYNKTSDLLFMEQEDIYANDKHYIADFVFNTENIDEKSKYKPYKLVIECDGHDFHEKTKDQVKRDNQRDYDLTLAGYDVLHFSGSQIYNEPFKCAEETLNLIISKIGK